MEVRIARIRKGLKLKELAELVGISVNSLVKIEKGETKLPRVQTINKLCEVLDKTAQELFFNNL